MRALGGGERLVLTVVAEGREEICRKYRIRNRRGQRLGSCTLGTEKALRGSERRLGGKAEVCWAGLPRS